MKTNFLSTSVLYWFIIAVSVTNLLFNPTYKGTLDRQYIIYFIGGCLALYVIATAIFLIIKNTGSKVKVDVADGKKRIYYESKMQYFVLFGIIAFTTLTLTIFNIAGLRDIAVYFLGISIAGLVFVYFYSGSEFILTSQTFIWKKRGLIIECLWSDVIAIHHDFEPAMSNVGRNFSSTSFFIETKKGMTKYADMSNLKIKGQYTPFSQADNFVKEIKLKSNAKELTAAVSMFKQTQKLKDIVFVLLAIILIPLLGILLYPIVTGTK